MSLSLLRQHLAWVLLVAMVLILAVLFATGRIRLRSAPSSGEEISERDQGSAGATERVNRNVVRLQRMEASLADLKVEAAQEHDLPAILTLPGEVQVAENRLARVTPSVAGVVRRVDKTAGDAVDKGAVLCVLESPELGDARAAYVEAFSEKDFAERNYERWKLLYDKGLRTQNEVYAAESDLTKAKIKVGSAEARLRALGLASELQALRQRRSEAVNNLFLVTSPLRGFVLDRAVTAGQSVETKDQIFQVADLSTVWIVAAAHENDLAGLRSGLKAGVQPSGASSSAVQGAVTSVGPQADEKTRTVQVRISAPNPVRAGSPLLRPGAFTNITIELAEKRRSLAVPDAAIQSDGPDSFVFVRVPEGGKDGSIAFARRVVTPGIRLAGLVEIREGLKAGEAVVTRNGYLLKAEMQKVAPED
jgi:membrane fusion protein, heavy metal efflux system